CRIDAVVFFDHPRARGRTGLVEDRLILPGKRIPLLFVDDHVQHRAAFPPAGEVVVFRHLVETELLVVIGTDELRGIDCPLLERWIYIAARDLLRHHAEPGEHMAAHARDAELEALEIIWCLDLLAEPAAHLRAGVAAQDRMRLERFQRLVAEFGAAAERPPGMLM